MDNDGVPGQGTFALDVDLLQGVDLPSLTEPRLHQLLGSQSANGPPPSPGWPGRSA